MNSHTRLTTSFLLSCFFSLLCALCFAAEYGDSFSQGSLTNDGRINDDSGIFNQSGSSIALSRHNFAVACWQDDRSGQSRIYVQRFGQRGLKFQNNFQIQPFNPAAPQFNADVAVDDLGHFVVVWEERGDSLNVYARVYAANAAPWTPILKVNEHGNPPFSTAAPAVAMNESGQFVVTWVSRHADAVGDIHAQRFSSAGQKLGGIFRVHDDTNHAQNFPDVAINESGRFVIVWEDGRDLHRPSHLYEIYARVYDSAGIADGGDFMVSHHPSGSSLPAMPSVALQNSGDFFVAWSYGSVDVYGHVFRADKQTIRDDFILSNLGGGLEIAGNNVNPRLCPAPGGLYALVWDSDRFGNSEIFFKSFAANGNQVGGYVILNDSPGNQSRADIAVSTKGLLLSCWVDDRNGNPDIYGTWRALRAPDNVVAGSGFKGRVPLTWDPLYGKDRINRYKIWRSLGVTSPLVLISTVDLPARGLLGYSMRDYIDFSAVNGQSYLYRIEADDPDSQGPSTWVTATPSAGGHVLQSGWSAQAPTINGRIAAGEWADATRLDISTASTPEPVILYIKNDDSHLYIAVDDPNDLIVDPGNTFGFLFDLDHNGQWDASGPSKEGLIQITPANALFVGAWGTYPNRLGADLQKNATGVATSISSDEGHLQYEISFDFASSPLKLKAGGSFGAALWVNDPGNHYFDHYGNAGEWPYGYLWEAAESLGDLVLATCVPPDTTTPPADALLVTHSGDDGDGSLRSALLQAINNPGRDVIHFNIPLSDPGYDAAAGVWVIKPTFPLPNISSDSTVVDGISQAKYLGLTDPPDKPLIVIGGGNGIYCGISISGSGNWINNLTINNFECQIVIGGHHNRISRCFIGTDASGLHRQTDSAVGISVNGGDYNFIGGDTESQRNVIAGCFEGYGLSFEQGACGNHVAHNYIGINSAGRDTLGNIAGINIATRSNGNRIGPGNVVSGNYGYGISVSSSDSTEIKGNLIGLDPTGTLAWGNAMAGISVSNTSQHTIIGGATRAERNTISGNGDGIVLFNGENSDNRISGNYIGTDISGAVAAGNIQNGIRISDGSHNIIGGSDSLGNVISGNGGDGLYLYHNSTSQNLIAGNIIGSDRDGVIDLKNGGNGIHISVGAANNRVGPANRILFNEGYGISVNGTGSDANSITRNSIYRNALGGIELYYHGNREMPAPTIVGLNPVVGTAASNATIEIFAGRDAQGETYFGTTTADAAGNFTWSGAGSGDYITATATDAAGNTSAFSYPFSTRGVLIVSNCQDEGAGSLRDAIRTANVHAGADTILFQIPVNTLGYYDDPGIWLIQSSADLTVEGDSLVIDGRSQAAFIGRDANPHGPEIVLKSALNNPYSGFVVNGKHNHIDAITITNFRYSQISIYSDSNRVTGCYLGTDETGNRRSEYSQMGIMINSGAGNIIGGSEARDRNVIAGLGQSGVNIVYGSSHNTIRGNHIGVSAAGTDTLIIRSEGIFLSSDAHHNTIGPGNIISGASMGISLTEGCGDSNRVIGNYIGTDAAGSKILGNRNSGIAVSSGGAFTLIGGLEASERNLISGNYDGIRLSGAGAHHNQIIGNYIGTDLSGNLPLPNESHGISISDLSQSNMVGPDNLIAFNGRTGVSVAGLHTVYNTISKNQIHSNGELGIDLFSDGNANISAPVLSGLNPLVGTAEPNSIVEIFSGPDDEGKIWEATVTADASGNFSWSGIPTGKYLTATATNATGNTSKFSAALFTAVTDASDKMPGQFALYANYPNPFNPATSITFELPHSARVQLSVFDIQGQKMSSLLKEEKVAGKHIVNWDGTDDLGRRAASGVYFYRIEIRSIENGAPLYMATRKMLFIK